MLMKMPSASAVSRSPAWQWPDGEDLAALDAADPRREAQRRVQRGRRAVLDGERAGHPGPARRGTGPSRGPRRRPPPDSRRGHSRAGPRRPRRTSPAPRCDRPPPGWSPAATAGWPSRSTGCGRRRPPGHHRRWPPRRSPRRCCPAGTGRTPRPGARGSRRRGAAPPPGAEVATSRSITVRIWPARRRCSRCRGVRCSSPISCQRSCRSSRISSVSSGGSSPIGHQAKSTTTGAWSEGFSPLRAFRSMRTAPTRAASGGVAST